MTGNRPELPSTVGRPEATARGRARRLRGSWAWALVVGAMVVVASFGTYYYLENRTSVCTGGPHRLAIETYASFFDSGPAPAAARAALFGGFENATHSTVCVEYVSGDLAQSLLTSPNRPDVVVGLDELTAPSVDAAGLLVDYASPLLSGVPSALVDAIAPDHSVTPYEYGYLGLDYNVSYDASHGHPFSSGDYLTDIEENGSLARQFLYELPTTDITGQEFLAMEVAYSEEVLHANWTTFWRAIGATAPSTTDWGAGFGEFSAGTYASFVSYTTDPAYNAYYGPVGTVNSSVLRDGGLNYSWETVYGVGIVRGGVHNLSLAEAFVNWMLSSGTQSAIPLNEWEYPAVAGTPLPAAFDWSVPPSDITPLNSFQSAAQTSADLPGWILEWQSAVSG